MSPPGSGPGRQALVAGSAGDRDDQAACWPRSSGPWRRGRRARCAGELDLLLSREEGGLAMPSSRSWRASRWVRLGHGNGSGGCRVSFTRAKLRSWPKASLKVQSACGATLAGFPKTGYRVADRASPATGPLVALALVVARLRRSDSGGSPARRRTRARISQQSATSDGKAKAYEQSGGCLADSASVPRRTASRSRDYASASRT